MKLRIVLSLAALSLVSVGFASPIPEFPFIAVDGIAEVDAAVSTATIDFTVMAHSKSAVEATDAVASATQSIVKQLTEIGIPAKSITAHDISKRPIRRSVEDSKELEVLGYDVQRNISVELSLMSNFVPVARILLRADKVTSVQSKFGIENEEALRQEAFARAYKVARARADALAKASGTVVEKVHAVSDQGLNELGERFVLRGRDAGVLSAPPPQLEEPLFAPDRMSFSCSVSVLFVLGQGKK